MDNRLSDIHYTLDGSFGLYDCGSSSTIIKDTAWGFIQRSIAIFEGEPIWLNVSITGNQFKYIITGLLFNDIMPPYFKEKFFESIQMIFVWKYNTNYFFIPYVLAMDVLYNKCWCCLIIDYIIHNILSYIYPLL